MHSEKTAPFLLRDISPTDMNTSWPEVWSHHQNADYEQMIRNLTDEAVSFII